MLFRARTKPDRETASIPVTFETDPFQSVYAVGDVHGQVDLLDEMVRRISNEREGVDDGRSLVLVFLGDYIDRGDHSAQVLDYLVRVKEAAQDGVRCLMGNHEAAMLDFLNGRRSGKAWLDFGGRQTVASYGVSVPSADPSDAQMQQLRSDLRQAAAPHMEFLESLEKYWVSGNYAFVHAGIDPAIEIDQQETDTLLFGSKSFLSAPERSPYRVVHGHYDARDPVVHSHRICVDTGAYYSGRLTAVCLDESEPRFVSTGS